MVQINAAPFGENATTLSLDNLTLLEVGTSAARQVLSLTNSCKDLDKLHVVSKVQRLCELLCVLAELGQAHNLWSRYDADHEIRTTFIAALEQASWWAKDEPFDPAILEAWQGGVEQLEAVSRRT